MTRAFDEYGMLPAESPPASSVREVPRTAMRGAPGWPPVGPTAIGQPVMVSPLGPFTMPSPDHLDGAVKRIVERGESIEGLRSATTDRWSVGYRSFRRYLAAVPKSETFFGGDVRVQRDLLEGWIGWMRGNGLSRNAIATYWRSLGALLARIARDREMLNPVLLVPAPKENLPHPAFLTRERSEDFLRYLANRQGVGPLERSRDLCLVGLMMFAGLRRQETLNLLVGDVNLVQRTLHIRAGKGRNGGRDRTAYMTEQLQGLVGDYLTDRHRHGRSHPELLTAIRADRPMGLTALRRLFGRASRDLRRRITPHQLRHGYATQLRMAGVSDRVAMVLLGHRSPAMLHRYSHVLDDEPAREALRLRLDVDLGPSGRGPRLVVDALDVAGGR